MDMDSGGTLQRTLDRLNHFTKAADSLANAVPGRFWILLGHGSPCAETDAF